MNQSQLEDREVLDLYQKGVRWREFQKSYGVSSRRLRKVLSAYSGETQGRKIADIKIDPTLDIVSQFRELGLVKDVAETGCIELRHRLQPDDYPKIQIKGKSYRVSRLVLQQKGIDLTGKQACHTCHNSYCINSNHLYAGTALQNAADKTNAGRNAVGERHGNARFTEAEVREIRKLHASGVSIGELIKRYKAGSNTIASIVKRRTWKHVV